MPQSIFTHTSVTLRRSKWLHDLRCGSAAARWLRLWLRCLSVVSVVCCNVEVSATSWSLVQRFLLTAVRRCVWSRILLIYEALTHWGLSRQKKKTLKIILCLQYVVVFPSHAYYHIQLKWTRNVLIECQKAMKLSEYRACDYLRAKELHITSLYITCCAELVSQNQTYTLFHVYRSSL